MIAELQAITSKNGIDEQDTSEHEIIEFLRRYFSHEDYADVFEKEREAKIANTLSKEGIERYIYDYLQQSLAAKYNIDCCDVTLNYIKAILFFKYIMMYLDINIDKNKERNKKIRDYKEVYLLFMALISEKKCDLSRHQKAVNIVGMTNGKQKELDMDEKHFRHITYANLIYDKFLTKYIEEYKNFL